MKRLFVSALALLLVASAIVVGRAQSTTGQIMGTVKDPTGLPLPGAAVSVTNLQTGQKAEIKSNEAGDYLARELPPGNYSVSATFSGFKQVLRTNINVVAFQNVRVDLPLEIGAASDQVVVTAEVPQVDTRSNTLGTVVPTRLLAEMPIADRNIINTLNYTPGVQHVSAGNNVNRNQQRLNIAGNRSYSTNTQLDGASMYFAHRGQGIEMPAPDAIEEVHVVTSGVSAQYGRGTAVFTAVTKSGGNELHGTAWEFVALSVSAVGVHRLLVKAMNGDLDCSLACKHNFVLKFDGAGFETPCLPDRVQRSAFKAVIKFNVPRCRIRN